MARELDARGDEGEAAPEAEKPTTATSRPAALVDHGADRLKQLPYCCRFSGSCVTAGRAGREHTRSGNEGQTIFDGFDAEQDDRSSVAASEGSTALDSEVDERRSRGRGEDRDEPCMVRQHETVGLQSNVTSVTASPVSQVVHPGEGACYAEDDWSELAVRISRALSLLDHCLDDEEDTSFINEWTGRPGTFAEVSLGIKLDAWRAVGSRLARKCCGSLDATAACGEVDSGPPSSRSSSSPGWSSGTCTRNGNECSSSHNSSPRQSQPLSSPQPPRAGTRQPSSAHTRPIVQPRRPAVAFNGVLGIHAHP